MTEQKLTAAQKKERNGTHFHMKDGPWDGHLIRVFKEDWGVFDWPEQGGMYVRPQDVDPYMQTSVPNKKHTNVPHMVWEAAVAP